MPSPVRQKTSLAPSIFDSIMARPLRGNLPPGTEGGDNGSLDLDMSSMPQPDAFLFIQPEYGGRMCVSTMRVMWPVPLS